MKAPGTLLSPLLPAADGLLTLLYPRGCLLCDLPGAPLLCEACAATLVTPLPAPICEICGHPAHSSPCALCRDDRPAFESSRAVGLYAGNLREAVHMLKFHDRPMLARPLGAIMASFARQMPHRFHDFEVDAVVPVPMARLRERRRGYNQAHRLAEAFAAEMNLHVRTDLLRRRGRHRPQVGLSREQRLRNLADAFDASPACAGLNVLLIDDVSTTGATQRACAAALKAAGAKAVSCLSLASE